jgi:protein-L-isoaspartate O-methyltransferase
MPKVKRPITKDPQYSYMFEAKAASGTEALGVVATTSWTRDPKRLVFSLSRYKFVAKMFSGFSEVLEVGCGDAWASRLVRQSVGALTVSDYDPAFVEEARSRDCEKWKMKYKVLDFNQTYSGPKYDGIYMLDVLEHIPKKRERKFLENLVTALNPGGVLIAGMPSLQSQSLIPLTDRDPGHVNCKTADQLRRCLSLTFTNVFLFSMNDEVIHTGNPQMAYYLLAVCCGPKN